MRKLRGGLTLIAFLAFTLPLMPLQWGLLRLGRPMARRLPRWYHRGVCRLIGVNVHVEGGVEADRSVLLVANHVSWLDIPVISTITPLSFVAKKDVEGWPLVGSLARLQRTIFVDRERRTSVHGTSGEILQRLHDGDHVVLFAEGTSGDGNRVLPFRTSLFAAAKPGARSGTGVPREIYVQTLAIAYTHLNGLPIGRSRRPRIAWYGDMELAGHAWWLLENGQVDARIVISPPIPLESFAHRKDLAAHAEQTVRENFTRLVVGRDPAPVDQAWHGEDTAVRNGGARNPSVLDESPNPQ